MVQQHWGGERWVDLLEGIDLPVLSATREMVRSMTEDPEFSIKDAGHLLMRDPGLVLRLMRESAGIEHKHRHFKTDPVNLHQVVMLLGINHVREVVEFLPVIEDRYPPHVQVQLRRLYGRAAYTALMARDWAVMRRDFDPDEVALAGLLNGLGGLVLWAAMPDKMESLADLRGMGGVPANEAEYVAVGFGIEPFGHALAVKWELPQLVIEGMDPACAREARSLGVILAVQACHAAAYGWMGPQAVENVRLAAEYLGLDLEFFAESVNAVTERYNGFVEFYELPPFPPLDVARLEESMKQDDARRGNEVFCLAPRSDVIVAGVHRLGAPDELPDTPDDLLLEVAAILRDGLGLNRVVFAVPSADGSSLTARTAIGADYEPAFNRFRVPLREGQLFTLLMKKPAAFWLNDGNREEAWPRIPHPVRELIGVKGFYAVSIFVHDRPYALAYADRCSDAAELDPRSFESFKRLLVLTAHALERIIPPQR